MRNPCCGQPAEVVSSADPKTPNAVPAEGDILICFTCHAWLIKTATGFRLFGIEDFNRLTDLELNMVRRISTLLRMYGKSVTKT